MRVLRSLTSLLAVLLLSGCGPAPEPVTAGNTSLPPPASASTSPTPAATATTSAEAPPPELKADFDPVALGTSAPGVKKICDDHLAAAQGLVKQIRALKGAPADKLTYEATLGRFDDVMAEIACAAELPYLLAVAHPDTAVREAAKLCQPKADAFTTALYLDADVAAVIRAYAAQKPSLEGEKQRLLSDVLRDFRRNGVELSKDKQDRIRAIDDQLSRLGQEFENNISSSTGHILVRPEALEGLPAEYKAQHQPKPAGNQADPASGKVEITIDYPDYFPFITYSKDRKAALELYTKFTNRGGEDNIKVLEKILALRNEKAKILGYESWAAYAIEPRMAKSPKAVADFLGQIRAATKAAAKTDMAELMKEHVKGFGRATDKLPPVERYFLQDRVRAAKYKLDTQELSKYFEIGAVTKGLLDITAKMYGIEYKSVPPKAWHPDVTAHEVWGSGKLIGKFYLDLHPRPGKYKHAAMFPIVQPKRLRDGSRLLPVAALECNFPKPGAEPALMSHEDVSTFFHEFGHVLHHLLTRSELASYSGSNTVRDFVEAPSQMFEEWPWSREVLDLFARHVKTGKKIPDDVFKAMLRARQFGRALDTQRQVFFASLDLEYHSRAPGFDTTQVLEEVQAANESFAFVKGTHFQSSFGHLIGYDAGYYSYQWALALSRDVLTRFKKEGLLNPAAATAWRDHVLSKGGGEDERAMITRFLGRPPNNDAYLAYIQSKD